MIASTITFWKIWEKFSNNYYLNILVNWLNTCFEMVTLHICNFICVIKQMFLSWTLPLCYNIFFFFIVINQSFWCQETATIIYGHFIWVPQYILEINESIYLIYLLNPFPYVAKIPIFVSDFFFFTFENKRLYRHRYFSLKSWIDCLN